MTENLKIFLGTFILSIPFWWGVNVSQEKLEDFLFWRDMASHPEVLMAQAAQENNLARLKPIRNGLAENLEIEAQSALSVFVSREGAEKILFEKNSQQELPIASLTKVMTANVVLEHYDVSEVQVAKLLYPLLISSSNQAATELAKIIGEEGFIHLMNLEAQRLGLENTHFANPTGLDPDDVKDEINYSTAQDLAKLAKYLTQDKPLIWEISALEAFEDNLSTNELLQDNLEIFGGKTGWTPLAKGCLIIVSKAPKEGILINVVLASEDRFGDMKSLITWINSAYKW